jgi:hypothetical protein
VLQRRIAVQLPTQANAHAERFVRTIKESCLDGMIVFGERSLKSATAQSVSRYLTERNHQGLKNRIINPEPCCGRKTGAIEQRQRLGGLFNT